MVIKLTVIGISALVLCACGVDRREIARSSSPNHQLIAIHIEVMGGGAAGFVAEQIFLNEQSYPTDLKHPFLNASHCERLSFSWPDDHTLQVHYRPPCSINQFTNVWYVPSDLAHGIASSVEIILVRDEATSQP